MNSKRCSECQKFIGGRSLLCEVCRKKRIAAKQRERYAGLPREKKVPLQLAARAKITTLRKTRPYKLLEKERRKTWKTYSSPAEKERLLDSSRAGILTTKIVEKLHRLAHTTGDQYYIYWRGKPGTGTPTVGSPRLVERLDVPAPRGTTRSPLTPIVKRLPLDRVLDGRWTPLVYLRCEGEDVWEVLPHDQCKERDARLARYVCNRMRTRMMGINPYKGMKPKGRR